MEPPKKRLNQAERLKKLQTHKESEYIPSVQKTNWQQLLMEDPSSVTASPEGSYSFYTDPDRTAGNVTEYKEQADDVSEEGTGDLQSEQENGKKFRNHISPSVRRILLLIRLAAASLMFAAAVLFGSLSSVSTVLLIISAVFAGYDVFRQAFRSILYRNISESSVIITSVTVVCFIIGFQIEGVALMILVTIGKLLADFLLERSKASAFRLIDSREELTVSLARSAIEKNDSDYLYTETVMSRSIAPLLSAGIVIAVLYAVLLPVISYYRPVITIHRAITIILVCTSVSVLISFPAIGRFAQCTAASYGVIFRNAYSIEKTKDVKTFVFDQSGLFSSPKPEVLFAHSDVLDDTTFQKLIGHIVYHSAQTFSRTILKSFELDFDPTLVTGFSESPGGISARISNCDAVFGIRQYVESRGYRPPENAEEEDGIMYYLFLSGRYGGSMMLSSDISDDISDIIRELRTDGINKCILITEQNSVEISEFAEINGFDVVYASVTDNDKYSLIEDICNSDRTKKMILTSDCKVNTENDQTVILAGEEMHEADAVVIPHMLSGICGILQVSSRISQLAFENAIFAFVIKALIIFFSMIGYCNIWMAIIADIVAALITILNSSRVASRSLISTFIDK